MLIHYIINIFFFSIICYYHYNFVLLFSIINRYLAALIYVYYFYNFVCLAISDKLKQLIKESNVSANELAKRLRSLKHENKIFSSKNLNSSEARIRENLFIVLNRKAHEILKEFQEAQADYKTEVRAKVTRQLKCSGFYSFWI